MSPKKIYNDIAVLEDRLRMLTVDLLLLADEVRYTRRRLNQKRHEKRQREQVKGVYGDLRRHTLFQRLEAEDDFFGAVHTNRAVFNLGDNCRWNIAKHGQE